MGAGPEVSVVMPAHQAEATIGRAVRSVLAQTFGDWELIVVDDGCTDGTADLVRSFDDPRIVLLQQANAGPSTARNVAIAAARAPYLSFLDADDEWLPAKLACHLPMLKAGAVCYSDSLVVEEGSGRSARYSTLVTPMPDGADALAWLLREPNPVQMSTVSAPTAAVRRVGGFDARFPVAEDLGLWIRLARAGHRFHYSPELLARYSVRAGSVSSDTQRMLRVEAAMIDDVLAGLDQPSYRRLAARRRDHLLAMCVVLERSDKPFPERRRDLLELLRRRPRPGTLSTQLLYTLSPAALARTRPGAMDGRRFEQRRAV